MTKTKSTKRALLLSALSLLMCVSMLIGSTFAWFSDTTSSAGNTIQSGKLEIALEKYPMDTGLWENAEGKTINFRTHPDSTVAAENILWEPGCTYWMEHIRVRNTGNLALKYDIVISGMTGDTKLLDVIKFEYTAGNGWQPLGTIKGELLPGETSADIIIRAHMDEDAGNDYQNLKLENISVAVSAQQLPYEYDSLGNQYDAVVEALGGGNIANAGSRYQIAVEVLNITGITDVDSFYIDILDANGNVMTKITPTQKTIDTYVEDGAIKGLTACAVVTGSDSSSWDNTAFVPDVNKAPAKAVLYVNDVEKGSTTIAENATLWAEIVAAYNANN